MKTFVIGPQGKARLQRDLIIRLVAVMGIAGVIAAIAISPQAQGDGLSLLLTVGFLLALFAFVLNSNLKKQRAIWESVRVELGPDSISRSQLRVPALRIERDQVQKIQETAAGLCLLTGDKYKSLLIPRVLDSQDYQEIRDALQSWRPIEVAPRSQVFKNLALLLLLLVGFGLLFFVWEPWVIVPLSVVLLGYYSYLFLTMRRAQGMDPQYLRNFGCVVGFLFFIVLMKLFAMGLIRSLP